MTLSTLELYSEPYRATGNVASEGICNQLGRPHLHPLALLIRETVQNSWDARVDESAFVRYSADGAVLTPSQRDALVNSVFHEVPRSMDVRQAMDAGKEPMVLVISDRNTSGLGGPTRADRLSEDPTDFADFLRNVGQPRDKALGGGTYGYGKAALYINSLVSTICVYTRCRYQGRLESRLIACGLGKQFEQDGRPYTGRHWWGRLQDGFAEPLLGEDADALARAIGFPGFSGDGRGTSIMVLLPDFREFSGEDGMRFIVECLLWHFWPKMIDRDGGPSMEFRVRWQGRELPVPDPRDVAPFSGFARSMERLMNSKDDRRDGRRWVVAVDCARPKQQLGRLALDTLPSRRGDFLTPPCDRPVGDVAHHVALMRNAHLVVKYLEGPVLPIDGLEYCGVFVCDEDVDDAFAKSEPPSHDEWSPAVLADRHQQTFVRVALRRVGELVREYVRPKSVTSTDPTDVPLAVFSNSLAGLLPGETRGEKVGERPRKASKKPAQRRERSLRGEVEVLGEPELIEVDGDGALQITLRIHHAEGTRGTRVVARPTVLLDGRQVEKDVPVGGCRPHVLKWSLDGDVLSRTETIELAEKVKQAVSVVVSLPGDVAVSVDFVTEAISAES